MTERAYEVELASSSRSHCHRPECDKSKENKETIPAGTVRLVVYRSEKKSSREGYYCLKPGCVTKEQAKDIKKRYGSFKDVPGIKELPKDKREAAIRVLQSIDEGKKADPKDIEVLMTPEEGEGAKTPSSAAKKGKGKRGKSTESEEAEGEDAAEEPHEKPSSAKKPTPPKGKGAKGGKGKKKASEPVEEEEEEHEEGGEHEHTAMDTSKDTKGAADKGKEERGRKEPDRKEPHEHELDIEVPPEAPKEVKELVEEAERFVKEVPPGPVEPIAPAKPPAGF